jgi:hypothetical protein
MKIKNYEKARKQMKKDWSLSFIVALVGSILIASSFTPRDFLWYHLSYDPITLAGGIMILFMATAYLIISVAVFCLAGWYKQENKLLQLEEGSLDEDEGDQFEQLAKRIADIASKLEKEKKGDQP